MIVFDTDVLTDILRGVQDVVQRGDANPAGRSSRSYRGCQGTALRGRLDAIRQAKAGKNQDYW